MMAGDHVAVRRGWYWHTGIYVGDGRVIENAPPRDGGTVRMVSWEEFKRDGSVRVLKYAMAFTNDEIVRRAIAQVECGTYSWWSNNCEHFTYWCTTGRAVSPQLDALKKDVRDGFLLFAATLVLLESMRRLHRTLA